MIPVPRGLVNTRRSVGSAPLLVITSSSIAIPVTAKPVLGLGIINGVSAHYRAPRLGHDLRPAQGHLPENVKRKVLGGPAHQLKRREGPAPHGVYIGESIGGGDPPPRSRVVHHRSEEVHRLDEDAPLRQTVYACVVAGFSLPPPIEVRRRRDDSANGRSTCASSADPSLQPQPAP